MSLDVRSIISGGSTSDFFRVEHQTQSEHQKAQQPAPAISQADLTTYAQELNSVAQTFQRRLKFTVNPELNTVSVKIIDGETDKVIKEIPPEYMQRLHIRIKEAIGLLFDQEI